MLEKSCSKTDSFFLQREIDYVKFSEKKFISAGNLICAFYWIYFWVGEWIYVYGKYCMSKKSWPILFSTLKWVKTSYSKGLLSESEVRFILYILSTIAVQIYSALYKIITTLEFFGKFIDIHRSFFFFVIIYIHFYRTLTYLMTIMQIIVLIFDGNSEHATHAWRKISFSEKKTSKLWLLSI